MDILLSALLYFSLASAYIQTYPALTCEIPSFKILRAIHSSGEKGLSLLEIERSFDKDELFFSRIKLLEKDNFIKLNKDEVSLSFTGNILATFFIVYRKLYGPGQGKG